MEQYKILLVDDERTGISFSMRYFRIINLQEMPELQAAAPKLKSSIAGNN